MFVYVFRYFFIIYCSIYTFFKTLHISLPKHLNNIVSIIFSITVSILIYILPISNSAFRFLLLYLVCFIFSYASSNTRFFITFIASIISFAITYIALTCSAFILSLIMTPVYRVATKFPLNSFIIITGILQFLLVFLLFRIKRLKKGMPFLFKSKSFNIGLFICTFIIVVFFLLHLYKSPSLLLHFFALLFILFLAFLLLFWWRRRITLDYVQKLRMDEVESLYKKISDNEQEIEKLNTNNDYLSKVIHKDNKLIPAMEMALHSYLLEAPTMEAEEARQFGADLLSQLQSMSAEREGIISNYQKNTDSHPKIGIYSVDAVILYMEKRAEKFNITYNLRFDNDIKDAIVGFIHERDMLHLLSDLIENAIIAVKDASHREIFLHIGFLQGCLFIDLYDSGIPFEPAVYQDFGNCQHTTHADSGGSGIGLMDIWNLKRKYKASLQIYEYLPDSDIYTKKIRLLFDRRNHFLLQTYRDKEIRSFITRSDLHVFPLKEMKKKDKE